MKYIFAFLIAISILAGAHSARAQDDGGRIIPSAREEVQLSFAPLVKKVAPAVVNIYTKRTITQAVNPFLNDPFFSQFFGNNMGAFGGGGLSRQQVESALGSGVIISADGMVVTNAHVIKDAEEITVVLPDGREFDADILVTDAPSDLAVLKISPGSAQLPYVTLKASESLEVGDLVLAIGNPFAVGQTVTSGIVSALARSSLNISDFNFFIQTDAAINPGNSGGPLVAMDGGVIGINTAIFSRTGGSLGIGFAIPSEMVESVVAAAKAGGGQAGRNIARPWLGIKAQKVSADAAESLGLPTPHGVLVNDLHSASPLRAAKVKSGDVIVAMNGREIRDPSEMKFRMATVPLGDHAEFEILRQGKREKVKVKAIRAPDTPAANPETLTGPHPLSGATVSNINPAVAEEAGIEREDGVVVTRVERGQAMRFVRPGDIVVEINGQPVKSVADLKRILAAPAPGWNLVLEKNGQTRQIVVR